jgi:hypothetical protein
VKIFIEGRGLAELANQIAEKRVKSVHVFDTRKYQPLGNEVAVVIGITIEQLSGIY